MPAERQLTPIGYKWLEIEFQENPIPHYVESYAAKPGQRKSEVDRDGRCREIYPHTQFRPETALEHLDFALKYEGLHLQLLRRVLPRLPIKDVTAFVMATPTGRNARIVAYLYESFSGLRLPLTDLGKGSYVDLADSKIYFTGFAIKASRWRINRNLIGDLDFSPMLRRTSAVDPERDHRLHQRCADFIAQVPAESFQRALRYLYAKETRTSYAIERETPTQKRAETFVALLQQAGKNYALSEETLVRLQNAIVDPRYAAKGWRKVQNYVGQTLAPGQEEIHLIPPKPQDITFLMKGLLDVLEDLTFLSAPVSARIPPIASAAIVSWLFVYFHPFEDGNGRIHRFLIHHVLADQEFGPQGVLLPVSAVLLNRPQDYEASLEIFSRPLKERTEYEFDSEYRLVVTNQTLDHFRYIDCTRMAEALYGFIEETIEKELPMELRYLQHYDTARAAMRDIVDMPEQAANLFLRLCLDNNGRISKKKRKHEWFRELSDDEVVQLEQAVSEAYGITGPPSGAAEMD